MFIINNKTFIIRLKSTFSVHPLDCILEGKRWHDVDEQADKEESGTDDEEKFMVEPTDGESSLQVKTWSFGKQV